MCDTDTGQKAKHIHKRQIHLLVREDVTLDYDHKGSIEKNPYS
jgi:hypothetical protein